MNFIKRKFSFQDEDGCLSFEDPSPQPPSAFSFQSIANKVSSTISAPTSPARTSETLVTALERSLANDRSRTQPIMDPDAKVILIIDNQMVDWSKYFRNPVEAPVRVEQADFPELDLICTEHSCLVEINQQGKDSRSFLPNAVFIGPGAKKGAESRTLIRSMITAQIPFLNSHRSVAAFLDKPNLKKQLRKITLPDGSRIPLLPSIHYPRFRKFQPTTSVPVVVTVNEGHSGLGKMKVTTPEELNDVEGIISVIGAPTEVEVEPLVDLRYDMHIQKIGKEFKTFMRRSISRNWKSNSGSAVLEQTVTSDRHKEYLRAISSVVGDMQLISIDILVSREGREFVHNVNDIVAFYGESQEEDRRSICQMIKGLLGSQVSVPPSLSRSDFSALSNDDFTPSSSTVSTPPPTNNASPPYREQQPSFREVPQKPRQLPSTNGNHVHSSSSTTPIAPPKSVSNQSISNDLTRSYPNPSTTQRTINRMNSGGVQPKEETHSFAEDTMGQLKRTFAGIFGDVN